MSRASTLSGFTTAIGSPTNLNVGIVTAVRINSTGSYSFNNLTATGIVSFTDTVTIGDPTVGVTTINSSGINSPLGVSTLGQVEIAGITTINSSGINSPLGVSTLGQVEIAGITTINSDGIQSTGIGTFNKVAIGTDNPVGAEIIASSKGYTTVSIRTDDDATGFPLLQFLDNRGGGSYQIEGGRYDGKFSIRTNSSIVANNQKDRIILDESGNVGLGSTAPTVSVDISEKTDAVALPVGTTAQRPSTAYGGYIRWNSTSSALEVYNGTNWVEIISDYFPSGSTTLG